MIREIHAAYYAAGADIVETNTFNSTTIAQADYGMESLVARAERRGGAARARASPTSSRRKDGRPRFVAGALGPTNRTASISPDVNDPGFRNVTFDELVARLPRGRRRRSSTAAPTCCSIETVFDTLNAKAAIFAIEQCFEARGRALPVMVSGTITDASGRTLSGQTTEAFWNSVRHAQPLAIGLNCALGAQLMRPYIQELARVADTYVFAYPNAGLPNPLAETGYDETPAYTAGLIKEFAQSGLRQHRRRLLRHDARAHQGDRRRRCAASRRAQCPSIEKRTRLSGLEPLNIGDDSLFVNVGERTNVTGSPAFSKLILAGDLRRGAVGRAPAGGERRADDRHQHGRGDARLEGGDDEVSEPDRRRAGHLARAGDDRLLEVGGDRGGAEVRAGQVRRQLDQHEGGQGGVRHARRGSRAATARRWS